jgi:hypothetical protein
MRKKSHISLAGQMMNALETDNTMHHRLTFYLANILPDCKPSFLTTPHTFDDTFEKLGEKMRKLVSGFEDAKGMTMRKTLCLGEITHYVADYFTFPHNTHYDGNLKDHCYYEGDLKRRLKKYIKSGQAMILKGQIQVFGKIEDLLVFIKERHREYMSRKRCVQDDMDYIITVCTSVMASLMHMCIHTQEKKKNAGYIRVS